MLRGDLGWELARRCEDQASRGIVSSEPISLRFDLHSIPIRGITCGATSTGHEGAGDSDSVIFQRQAHEFKNVAEKFELRLEMEQASVPQWNFIGTKDHSAIDASSIGVGPKRREWKQLAWHVPGRHRAQR
jgi:hypothetical protein